MAGGLDEDVFEGWLAYGDGIDQAGEGFDELGDEFVAAGFLEADDAVEGFGFQIKFIGDDLRDLRGLCAAQGDDVAADAVFQNGGRVAGGQAAVIQNGESGTAVGFVHEVGGEQDRDAVVMLDFAEVAPEVYAGGGVEAGAGFVEEEDLGAVEHSLGEFDAAAHAAGESFDAFVAPVGKSDLIQQLIHAFLKFRAAESVEVALAAQIFVGG